MRGHAKRVGKKLSKAKDRVSASRFATQTIEAILEERGWSESDAARAWALPQATLNGITTGRHALSLGTLDAICAAERWTPFEFFAHHPGSKDAPDRLPYAATALAKAIQGLEGELISSIGLRVGRLGHLGLQRETAELVEQLMRLMEQVADRARDPQSTLR